MSDQEQSVRQATNEAIERVGINTEVSVIATPNQNGTAEASGHAIIAMARSLLINGHLPRDLWPEAMKAAVYILNRVPTRKSDKWIIPYQEMLFFRTGERTKLNLANLRVFVSLTYCRKVKDLPQSQKMAPRAEIGYLVGYVASNTWRIWFPHRNCVEDRRDCVFDENQLFNPDKPVPEIPVRSGEYQAAYIYDLPDIAINIDDLDDEFEPRWDTDLENTEDGESGEVDQSAYTAKQTNQTNPIRETDLAGADNSNLPTPSPTPSNCPVRVSDSDEQNGPVPESSQLAQEQQTREIGLNPEDPNNIIDRPRRRTQRIDPYLQSYFLDNSDNNNNADIYNTYYFNFTTALEPQIKEKPRLHRNQLPLEPEHWKDAMKYRFKDKWIYAAEIKKKSLEKMGTFSIDNDPRQLNQVLVLPLRWVFTYKFDSDSYLTRFKARILVRRDLEPVSPEETRAITLAHRSFRTIMALVAAFDLDISQFDATNAFLNSYLEKPVYILMPEGFRQKGKVWCLKRALYGLRASPRLWQLELSKTLETLGLTQVPEDPCVFVGSHLIILIFVDDVLIINTPTSAGKTQASLFREKFKQTNSVKDLGPAKWFLGIRIIRDREQNKL